MTEFKRFFSSSINFDRKTITLDRNEHHHLCNVLRAKPGEKIIISLGDGTDYLCEVKDITNCETTLTIIESRKNQSELQIPLTLFQASLKSNKMELVIQKAVELGVGKIVPIKSRYTVGSLGNKLIRYRKIIFESMKQCGRAQSVDICEETPFEEMISQLHSYDRVLFCDEVERACSIHSILNGLIDCDNIAIIVGCEGGFSFSEREALAACTQSVTLGKRILRAETAAISILSIVSSFLDSQLK